MNALTRPRFAISMAVLLSLLGVFAWLTMPRQEDPTMPGRFALVVAQQPGADPEAVERLLLDPIEEELAEVHEIKHVDGEVRTGLAIVRIFLNDATDTQAAIDEVWDEVRERLDEAALRFPDGVAPPTLDRDMFDMESVVLAITGSNDPLALAAAADRLERALVGLPLVKRVTRVGDPGEQVTIELDDAVARELGVDPRSLGGLLASRNALTPGGAIEAGPRLAVLRPDTELESLEEIAATPVPLASGAAVPLGQLARVRRGPLEPATERMRLDGAPAVALGIVPVRDVNLLDFGAAIREVVAEQSARIAPLEVHELAFQPNHVEERLSNLAFSLGQSIGVVALVVLLFMGPRLGLVVSAIVPLVAFASLAIYAMGGGVLHQMSIAAIVIALGMLVDNAIVVAEDVQARIDAGTAPKEAARAAVASLWMPLASATGTTLAAFVPMLVSEGPTADFTRALPILIMLTLTVSYVFAVLVTPAVAAMVLRRQPQGGQSAALRVGKILSRLSVERPGRVLAAASLLVGVSVGLASRVELQFFPSADRNQVMVDLALPEGSTLENIDAASARLEEALAARTDVTSVASFIGRAAPHFYYNVMARPSSPHLAQLLVIARDNDSVGAIRDFARDFARRELPEVTVVASRLEQGPPVVAPIEVRVFADDLEELREATDSVMRAVATVPGSHTVRNNLGTGVPSVRFHVDDAAAARHGVTRSDVALTLLGQTRGLPVGQLRTGEDPVPIVVRSSRGEETPSAELLAVDVSRPGAGAPVPLGEIARAESEWRPAVIRHRDRRRLAQVLADLDDDVTFSTALRTLEPALREVELPPGVRLELGGLGEGSSDANSALLLTVPVGFLLLVGILLLEFNSFRRVAIVLSTVPLAAVGVVPGLLVGDQPFGFMSMLGIIALAGIVVNNAIVLLDFADRAVAEGASVADAARDAVLQRTRPIFLTTVTTVVGLVPLALSPTSLWPPLAWSMISGLVASTGLTLLVCPALYVLLLRPRALRLPSFARA